MTEMIDVIESIVSDFEKTCKEFQVKAQKTMKLAFTEFFKVNPTITSIEWTQYTPYFNDGDECTFSVHEMYAMVGESNEEYDYPEDCENCLSSYGRDDKYPIEAKAFHAFIKTINKIPDEVYEATFGNHVKVVATRKGFEIVEYDHE